MNAPTLPDAIETVEPAVESVIKNFVEQEYAARPPKVEFDGERIKTSIALFSSKSIKELEGLTFELKALQDFLKSETERVQHNIDTALAGMQIIIDTIAPWRTLHAEKSGTFERPSKLGIENRLQRLSVPGSPTK